VCQVEKLLVKNQTRQSKLLELIRTHGFATLPELSKSLSVSESTVRRDLNALEAEGVAKRTHGGVIYTGPSPNLPHFETRQQENWDQKRVIAETAAGLIQASETILLDGGSTTYELAQRLQGRSLQIVTNSLPVANLFASDATTELVFIGGVIQSLSGVALGPHAIDMLNGIRCHKAFISAAGITESGLFNSNMLLVETERAMLRSADESILVADSSKFGQSGLAHVCGLEQLDRVIVDDEIDDNWKATLAAAHVHLTLAHQSEVVA